ncbi:uncharacterized protein LOC122261040 [Penaeus japonicus]|uniref:uncharacterized protein LOC122261040 n=1 Tax=Penaeus japonicus TaxID=27405 RepID=UPI001C70B89A|nr:uncharacterized protein LOC122261040 [Penaeus japonicus]
MDIRIVTSSLLITALLMTSSLTSPAAGKLLIGQSPRRTMTDYDAWAADLKPGFKIVRMKKDGQWCSCKVPAGSSSSSLGMWGHSGSLGVGNLPSHEPEDSSLYIGIFNSKGSETGAHNFLG